MMRNKTITLILLSICFLILPIFIDAGQKGIKNLEMKAKKIFSINKTSSLFYYAIKNNELYLVIWKSGEGKFVFKYEQEKLKLIKMNEQEQKTFISQYAIPCTDTLANRQLEIGDNKSLILHEWTEAINFYNLYIYAGKEEQNITKDRYLAILNENYLYIDKDNLMIYFDAWNRTEYIDKNEKDGQKTEASGLFVYDIRTDDFKLFKSIQSEKDDNGNRISVSYINPIRVPNTKYLMYVGSKNISYVQEDRTMNIVTEIWIQEIPEWKAEIEAQNKEKVIESSNNARAEKAIKYVIDGPANIRKKAKGKELIGSLETGAEVRILSKKGDWYEIEGGGLQGWTYKDNVKEKAKK